MVDEIYNAFTSEPEVLPGDVVNITGAGFGVEFGSVYFNDTAATVLSWANDMIVAVVPQTIGNSSVVVTVKLH